ncbi:MAG TPA: ABC transporter ATP-binding protein [Magnetospirillaceae bacterium]|jgi:branched-chain amino acid transport system ATP-binding protein
MLELDQVSAAYGPATALRNVSLRVAAGELVCVVGPNGAGKTTLINVIAGLHRVGGGRLAIDATDLAREPAHAFCAHGIALVPEGRRLFTGLSVRENLELGAWRRAARSHRRTQFERVLATFPALAPRLETPAGQLSGGQQQMVAIGRALMAQPRLLLLDEPSLGLAPAIVLEMLRVVSAINREGVAVLLVEQNVAMALEIATRAYVLEEGSIAGEGTPRDLLAQPHIRRAYLGEAAPG